MSTPKPPVGGVVAALFTAVGLSVVFAAATVVFRAQVAAHQGGTEAAVWIRAGMVGLGALLYAWLARRLSQGSRRAYLRIRALAVIGVIGVGYLLVSGQYPPWLRAVQGLQLAALITLAVLTFRVRAHFPKPPRTPGGDRWAALVLVVLAPVSAEVTLGSTPLRMIWLVLLWLPIYGAGVLFIRELARRHGLRWPAVLLLGLAYGVVEEGIALQALSSPTLYGAGDWAPRLLGINTAYTEVMLPYHAVFSVAIPIVLTELLFPASRTAPYLRRGGFAATGVVAVLGVALLRLAVPPTEDPGYVMPVAVLVGCVVAVVLLGLLAFRLPRAPAAARPSPGPWAQLAFGAAATFGFLALLYPFGGATRPAFTHGAWTWLPMGAALVLLAGTARLVSRWGERHVLALVSGALIAHTAFGAIRIPDTTAERLGLIALGAAMTAGLALLARRTAHPHHVREAR
ncbi:hypothetical protein Afil01_25700 [Actinorhabdospora filicis]|uniref:Uncharacterized protein n=1 Tax=Actinorhabdospora filicis TaxID=1785913 RepID=A0A9W6SK81_9ACTN|nr:hypothetical protein [Actinorhabdospora filicis]GLZ77763.1 hypothetical protein Afil01_25700 [Actinorhabdospora filicis]